MSKWSADDIIKALEKVDLYLRPQALLINPGDKELLGEEIYKIEKKVKIYTADLVEPGKAYLIDRKYLETYGGIYE